MTTTPHTIAIEQVESLLAGARRQGRLVAPLLLRAGIAPALLQAPLARVSLQQYAALIRALRRETRDELWGLTSRPLQVGSFARCVRQLVLQRTLGEALREGLTIYHGWIDDFVARLQREPGTGHACLVIELRRPADPCLDYAQKAFLLFAYGLACWLVARRVPLVRVNYSQPNQGAATARMYQAPVLYGQARIGLVFEPQWLALPVVQTPHSAGEFLARAPANLLIRYRDTGRVTERIRRLLRHRLPGPPPSLEAVARQLDLTPQTLRRRLREEGHGFQALKDDLRRDAAIEALGRGELPLAEVALLLGFSDASTFHRAFKKWTGVAPGEYRLARSRAEDGRPGARRPAAGEGSGLRSRGSG